jgi:hypothetical protein
MPASSYVEVSIITLQEKGDDLSETKSKQYFRGWSNGAAFRLSEPEGFAHTSFIADLDSASAADLTIRK